MRVLETERLTIRPFIPDDLEQAHRILDVDLHWSGAGFSLTQRRERLQLYISLSGWADSGQLYGYRAVVRRDTSQLIGICGFIPCVWPPSVKALLGQGFFGHDAGDPDSAFASLELEIGYALATDQRGRGYATEAACALIAYAFGELRIRRVLATTDHANTGSRKVMTRLGMTIVRNPRTEWPGIVGILVNAASEI